MQKILDIAWLHLKTTFQQRAALIFGLVMPVLFTFVIGLGIRGFEGVEPPSSWPISVVDEDQGAMATELIEGLSADPALSVSETDAETAAAALEAGEAGATLILPQGMSAALLDGQSVRLEFQLHIEEQIAAQVVEQAVLAALDELSSSLDIAALSLRVAEQMDLFALDGAPEEEAYYEDSLAAAQARWREGVPVQVEAQKETRREDTTVVIPNGFAQTSPGMAVMFAMFFIVAGTGSILLEREQGTLRRLLITPASKIEIMAGKLLGVYVSAVVQFSLLVLAGQFLFDVDWGQSPPALIILILAFTFCITALGMLLAALVRTYAQMDAMSTILIIPLSGIGGAMWPIEIVPEFMQTAALFVPTGWALRGFHDLITRGLGLQDVLTEAAVLVGFGVVFLAIGVWRFRYE